MLASFFSWWLARISELLPSSWANATAGAPDGVIIDVDRTQNVTASIRRKGREEPVSLGVAARHAVHKPVSLRPGPEAVLEKRHVVPTASRRELEQLLRYELARITPFKADDVYWRWDGRPKAGDKSRTNVTLTLVPKSAVAAALDTLGDVGIQPRYVEAMSGGTWCRMTVQDEVGHSNGELLRRGLAWSCGGLAVLALALPVLLQERALYVTDSAIQDLKPMVAQVEALRRGITAGGAGQEVLAKEMERTGDLVQILATITRILPDDTYLTDFSLHDRQITLGGRSAAAARLITGLSADPAIRGAAFAAPVTRIEGATTDVFSIRAEVAR